MARKQWRNVTTYNFSSIKVRVGMIYTKQGQEITPQSSDQENKKGSRTRLQIQTIILQFDHETPTKRVKTGQKVKQAIQQMKILFAKAADSLLLLTRI